MERGAETTGERYARITIGALVLAVAGAAVILAALELAAR
jgi:hypothetical protein